LKHDPNLHGDEFEKLLRQDEVGGDGRNSKMNKTA
jgi:hypothetical protein